MMENGGLLRKTVPRPSQQPLPPRSAMTGEEFLPNPFHADYPLDNDSNCYMVLSNLFWADLRKELLEKSKSKARKPATPAPKGSLKRSLEDTDRLISVVEKELQVIEDNKKRKEEALRLLQLKRAKLLEAVAILGQKEST